MDEAGGVDGECFQAVKETSNNVCFIMNVGWSIYPLGYFEDPKQTIAKPKWATRSERTEDCFGARCCDIVSYKCFTTKPEQTRCLKNCTPSMHQPCIHPQGIMDPISQDAIPAHEGPPETSRTSGASRSLPGELQVCRLR